MVYFSVILVFAIGAGIGSVVTKHLGNKAIWVCCASLTISFCMMFIDLEVNERRAARAKREREKIKEQNGK